MQLLLHLRADVDAGSTDNGWSPLILASWKQDSSSVSMLLAAGADVNHSKTQPHGFTPLSAAAAGGSADTCKTLLAAGADAKLASKLISSSACMRNKEMQTFIEEVVNEMGSHNKRDRKTSCTIS